MTTHWSLHIDPFEWADASEGEAVLAARTARGIITEAIDDEAPIDSWRAAATKLGLRVRAAEPREYALIMVGQMAQDSMIPDPTMPEKTETLVLLWSDGKGERAMVLLPFLRVAGALAWGEPLTAEAASGHLAYLPVEAAFWRAAGPS